MANLVINPPSWQPDAVATENGWVHPTNGELLVAISRLLTKRKEIGLNDEVKEVVITEEKPQPIEVVVHSVEVSEDLVQELKDSMEETLREEMEEKPKVKKATRKRVTKK